MNNSSQYRQVLRIFCCRAAPPTSTLSTAAPPTSTLSTAAPPTPTPTTGAPSTAAPPCVQHSSSRHYSSIYQRIFGSVAETMSEIERLSGIGLSSNMRNVPIPTGSAEEVTARGEMKKGKKRPFTVIVEGNIGSGKTTFLQHFSKFKHVDLLTEPVDKWRDLNGYNLLQRMYEDPARWSLTFQTYVQLTMLENHVKRSGLEIKMMERSIHSAKFCFVENLYKTGKMPPSEYEVISAWFDFLKENPSIDLGVDLIVYLQTTPEKALERVKARSRGEEHLIPLNYLTELHNLHEDWLIHEKFPLPAPVLILDANKSLQEMKAECLEKENMILGEAEKENMIPRKLKENLGNSHMKKQNASVERSPLKPRLTGAVTS